MGEGAVIKAESAKPASNFIGANEIRSGFLGEQVGHQDHLNQLEEFVADPRWAELGRRHVYK